MAQIIFTIPADHITRVLAAFGAQHNYEELLPNGDANPETLAAFTKRHIKLHIRSVVESYEASAAVNIAKDTFRDGFDLDVT